MLPALALVFIVHVACALRLHHLLPPWGSLCVWGSGQLFISLLPGFGLLSVCRRRSNKDLSHCTGVKFIYTHVCKNKCLTNALHTVIQMTESRFRRFGFDQKRYHQLDQGARRCAGPPCELLCSRCTEWFVCLLAFLLPLQEQRSFWPTVVSIPVPWQCTLST